MTEVRPLLVSFWDNHGGAASAMYRLHQGLQQARVDSQIMVGHKYSDDPSVRIPWIYRSKSRRRVAHVSEKVLKKFYRKTSSNTPWSSNLFPTLGAGAFNRPDYNVINLHWVGSGFVPISTVAQIRKPIVWTLHDMWPFTGGCHYSGSCSKYVEQCGACPQLGSSQNLDLSRAIWRMKHQQWLSSQMVIVAPSQWLAQCARDSALFHQQRIEVIPNGIDTTLYRPMAKAAARIKLGLPQEAQIVLFIAMNSTSDPRKGYQLLRPALHRLVQDATIPNLQIVIIGSDGAHDDSLPKIPIHYMGRVNDEQRLALLYAAADVMVAPSLEDNLPNTVLESLACGTPSVAFAIGGMPDMIEHQATGYLARPFEIEDLAYGISWVLEDGERHARLAYQARVLIEREFSLSLQAKRYISLYSEVGGVST